MPRFDETSSSNLGMNYWMFSLGVNWYEACLARTVTFNLKKMLATIAPNW